MEDIVIKIGASAKQFTEEMEKAERKTESLSDTLRTVTIAASAQFVGLTATVAACVAQFNEQEAANRKLEAVLRSTGGVAGVTAGEVEAYAKALDQTTVFSEDTIKATQTVMLRFTNLGKEVFPEATKSILDFAAGTGQDATSAAEILGKALNEPTEGMMRLSRQGITFSDQQKNQIKVMELSGDVLGAQRVILEAVATAHGGMAEEAAKGGGQIQKLKQQASEFAEDMGQHFAPIVNSAAGAIAKLIAEVRENEQVFKLGTAFVTAGIAVSGAAAIAGVAGLGFLKLKAAMVAAQVSTDLLTLSTRMLVGATGIGAVVLAVTYLALNWDTSVQRMRSVWEGFSTFFVGSAGAFRKILSGIFSADLGELRQGVEEFKANMKSAWETGTRPVLTAKVVYDSPAGPQAPGGDESSKRQEEIKKTQALEAERKRYEYSALTAHNQALMLEYAKASAERIAYKEEESKLLKQISEATGSAELAGVRAAAQRRLAEVRTLEGQAAALERQRQQSEKELRELEQKNASADLIALKKKEVEEISKLQDVNFKGDRKLAQAHLAETKKLYQLSQAEETTRNKAFDGLLIKNQDAYQKLSLKHRIEFERDRKRVLVDGLDTRADAEAKFYEAQLQKQIESHNQFYQDELQYGTAVAAMKQVFRSEDLQHTADGFSELSQLTNSSHSELKAVGQVAATSQIVIKTAEAAMNIFAGFSTIPFIGPALGIAAAAAAIAYGAEQIGRVWAAREGGVMAGGIAGRDSIPTLMMPGELITPTQNFEEVIGSVAAQRAAQKLGTSSVAVTPVQVGVDISFRGNAAKYFVAEITKAQAIGTYRGGS